MLGIIGRKIGMISIYSVEGKVMLCIVIEVGFCVVMQVKIQDKDGYEVVQFGFGECKEKNILNVLRGYFKKVNIMLKLKLVEFKGFEVVFNFGDIVNVDFFEEGEFVGVIGIFKGKGFQGVVKCYGFGGVGQFIYG